MKYLHCLFVRLSMTIPFIHSIHAHVQDAFLSHIKYMYSFILFYAFI